MYLLRDILISEDLFKQQFTCNLSACQGACCWEGDWGAPLDEDEINILTGIRERLRPFLSASGNDKIDEVGTSVYYESPQMPGTPLIDGAACAYLTYDEMGVGQCGIEKAHQAGEIDFKKPISCHLYPVRHSIDKNVALGALNYEEWNICNPACVLGKSLKMPVFRFLKDALVRKFGADFYSELEEIARDLH